MNRFLSVLAIASGLAIITPSQIIGQEPRRAAVMTAKGDLAEGVLKSVTDTEAVIEIAGQGVHIPIR